MQRAESTETDAHHDDKRHQDGKIRHAEAGTRGLVWPAHQRPSADDGRYQIGVFVCQWCGALGALSATIPVGCIT